MDRQYALKDLLLGITLLCVSFAIIAALASGPNISESLYILAWLACGTSMASGIGAPIGRWKAGAIIGLLCSLAILGVIIVILDPGSHP